MWLSNNPLGVCTDGTVVFCTGGNGTICSAQVKALVYLGADACIVGRNVEKTLKMAEDISGARPHSRVLGIGNVDVRNSERLNAAVEECVAKLGAIDFVMQVTCPPHLQSRWNGGALTFACA